MCRAKKTLGGNMQKLYIFGWFSQEVSSVGGINRVFEFTEGFRQSSLFFSPRQYHVRESYIA